MRGDKKFGLVQTFSLIKSGLSPAQISRKYNLPKQNIDYYVGKLKKLGCIEKKGYGVWNVLKELEEVQNRHGGSREGQTLTSSKKEIRGHAFIWRIEFFDYAYNWKGIIKSYKKKKLKFQLMFNNKVYRTIFNNKKIWLTRDGIIIYEPLDFVGKSSFQVKGTAVYEMDKLVKDLLKELNIKFRPYRFTTSREHYGMVKNELARQYNDRKEKMLIKSEEGTVWLWIDDSESLGELETNNPNISRQVQNFWNDHKKHKFQVTPSFLLNSINRNAEHLEFHAENMRSHVEAIKDLGKASKDLRKEVKKISRVFLGISLKEIGLMLKPVNKLK